MSTDAQRCPLCGSKNDCRIANGCAYQGPCWCEAAIIPTTFQRHPASIHPHACLCRERLNLVVAEATRDAYVDLVLARIGARVASSVGVSDFYLDENGRTVFTAAFHLKRGYCCRNGCRHCPYDVGQQTASPNSAAFLRSLLQLRTPTSESPAARNSALTSSSARICGCPRSISTASTSVTGFLAQ